MKPTIYGNCRLESELVSLEVELFVFVWESCVGHRAASCEESDDLEEFVEWLVDILDSTLTRAMVMWVRGCDWGVVGMWR